MSAGSAFFLFFFSRQTWMALLFTSSQRKSQRKESCLCTWNRGLENTAAGWHCKTTALSPNHVSGACAVWYAISVKVFTNGAWWCHLYLRQCEMRELKEQQQQYQRHHAQAKAVVEDRLQQTTGHSVKVRQYKRKALHSKPTLVCQYIWILQPAAYLIRPAYVGTVLWKQCVSTDLFSASWQWLSSFFQIYLGYEAGGITFKGPIFKGRLGGRDPGSIAHWIPLPRAHLLVGWMIVFWLVVGCMDGWLVVFWLVGWFLVGWLVGWLVVLWLFFCLCVCLFGLLADRSVWLVVWLAPNKGTHPGISSHFLLTVLILMKEKMVANSYILHLQRIIHPSVYHKHSE